MADSGLYLPIAVFVAAAVTVAVFGYRLSRYADQLADATGLGEAFVGAVLLGGATSLPGIVAVITAATEARPALAFSTAVGGIAVQTAFLAFGDLAHRGTNLEHAAASASNLLAATVLISLLSLLLVSLHTPDVALFGVHPVTPILAIAYLAGIRLVYLSHEKPMWLPQMTPETRREEDQASAPSPSLARLLGGFVGCALVVAVAGWALGEYGAEIADRTGLSDSFVGGFLVGVSTSLPELVTVIAAVRAGALTLAMGGIIGGNTFDTLFVVIADIAYREGSIYHAVTIDDFGLLSVTVLMTGVLLTGMLHRQRRGPANIGFESVLLLLIYMAGVAMLGFG